MAITYSPSMSRDRGFGQGSNSVGGYVPTLAEQLASQGGGFGGSQPMMAFSGGDAKSISSQSIPIPSAPAAPVRPTLQQFSFSPEATQYPTFLRSLGENQAQEAFQQQVNQGVRSGAAFQGYQRALNQRNQSRLGYMGQAGQEQLRTEQSIADAVARYNDQLTNLYGVDVGDRGRMLDYIAQLYGLNLQQRGQDLNYQASMNNIYSRPGQTITLGGGGGGGPAPASSYRALGQPGTGSNYRALGSAAPGSAPKPSIGYF